MSVRTLRYNTATQHFTKSARASTDRDALAFLEAAQIYNTNQQRAIVNLVRSLKRVGLWSKMKAIYPFVGGTATSHKWNLKDPRDVDAAFRLAFNGGWTHSSTGADPNGTNAYANTFCNPTNNLSLNSQHLSFYSREEKGTNINFQVCMGVTDGGNSKRSMIYYDGSSTTTFYGNINDTFTGTADWVTYTLTSAKGLSMTNRASSTDLQAWRNGVKRNNKTETADGLANANIWIGNAGTPTGAYATNTYIPLECAFATIGDGLTDTDASNLYTIVQRYQFQLGRAIEPDAQAFIDAAGITDATQQAAILDLVVRLKNDGLWTKMKAIYPFVGGTATSHKWNLKDPRDVDAAFRLTFSGGWTHSSTGALPNGSNTYADTYITPTTHLTENSTHLAYYSRTDTSDSSHDIAMRNNTPTPITLFQVVVRANGVISGAQYSNNDGCTATNSDGRCMAISSRTSSTFQATYRNATQVQTSTRTAEGWAFCTYKLWIAARNNANVGEAWSTKQCAFASIGDGLTATDASNLYNIVDLFQKRLGRAV